MNTKGDVMQMNFNELLSSGLITAGEKTHTYMLYFPVAGRRFAFVMDNNMIGSKPEPIEVYRISVFDNDGKTYYTIDCGYFQTTRELSNTLDFVEIETDED